MPRLEKRTPVIKDVPTSLNRRKSLWMDDARVWHFMTEWIDDRGVELQRTFSHEDRIRVEEAANAFIEEQAQLAAARAKGGVVALYRGQIVLDLQVERRHLAALQALLDLISGHDEDTAYDLVDD
jgi:hypothetical protein